MYLITNQQVANTKNTISLTKYNKFQINSSISKKTKQAIKTYDKQKTKKYSHRRSSPLPCPPHGTR